MHLQVGILCAGIWLIIVIQEILFWKNAIKIPGKIIGYEQGKRGPLVSILKFIPNYFKIAAYTYNGENKQVMADWASCFKPVVGEKVVIGIAQNGKARIYAPFTYLLHTAVFMGVFYMLCVYMFVPMLLSGVNR